MAGAFPFGVPAIPHLVLVTGCSLSSGRVWSFAKRFSFSGPTQGGSEHRCCTSLLDRLKRQEITSFPVPLRRRYSISSEFIWDPPPFLVSGAVFSFHTRVVESLPYIPMVYSFPDFIFGRFLFSCTNLLVNSKSMRGCLFFDCSFFLLHPEHLDRVYLPCSRGNIMESPLSFSVCLLWSAVSCFAILSVFPSALSVSKIYQIAGVAFDKNPCLPFWRSLSLILSFFLSYSRSSPALNVTETWVFAVVFLLFLFTRWCKCRWPFLFG